MQELPLTIGGTAKSHRGKKTKTILSHSVNYQERQIPSVTKSPE